MGPVGPRWAPWTLLSGKSMFEFTEVILSNFKPLPWKQHTELQPYMVLPLVVGRVLMAWRAVFLTRSRADNPWHLLLPSVDLANESPDPLSAGNIRTVMGNVEEIRFVRKLFQHVTDSYFYCFIYFCPHTSDWNMLISIIWYAKSFLSENDYVNSAIKCP